MLMDTHAHATTHVGDDEVEVLVVLAQLAGIEFSRHLLVEAVPDDTFTVRVEVENGVTRNLGILGTLVHDAGVGDVSTRQTDFGGDGIADQCAQVAGMLALDTVVALLFHQVVDAIDAAFARAGQTAAAHDYGNLVGTHAVAFQHIEDGTLAVVELVSHLVELLYFLNRM